jgi:serine/threonine protein kinase
VCLQHLSLGVEIGTGVSAQVFRGTYYGQEVAVKRLFSSLWEQEKFDEFFRAEAKMMRALNHPNVVRFFGAAYDPASEHGCVRSLARSRLVLSRLLSAYPRRLDVFHSLLCLLQHHTPGIS